ncbi:MAG: hypothetical protein AB7F59_02095 [Bdellovibrionales bacterium]
MSIFGRLLCAKAVLFSSGFALATPSFQTLELNDKSYDEMYTIVKAETRKCYDRANEIEKAASREISVEQSDQFIGEDQSPELVACLTKVSGLVLARKDLNDKVVPNLFQKSTLELNDEHRKFVLKAVLESAVADYKALLKRVMEATGEDRRKLIPELATSYEQIVNSLSELKPLLKKQPEEAKPLFKFVSQADLEPTEELKNFHRNHGGGETLDLSEKAEEILEEIH